MPACSFSARAVPSRAGLLVQFVLLMLALLVAPADQGASGGPRSRQVQQQGQRQRRRRRPTGCEGKAYRRCEATGNCIGSSLSGGLQVVDLPGSGQLRDSRLDSTQEWWWFSMCAYFEQREGGYATLGLLRQVGVHVRNKGSLLEVLPRSLCFTGKFPRPFVN